MRACVLAIVLLASCGGGASAPPTSEGAPGSRPPVDPVEDREPEQTAPAPEEPAAGPLVDPPPIEPPAFEPPPPP